VAERTEYTPGTFCWADVGGADPDAQQRFYERLLGWTAELTPGGYWMMTLGGKNVAGMFEPPEEGSPGWISYVSVESADDTTARARELGATALIEPRDVGVPGVDVGRMALLADPQGAAFALWQPGLHIGAQLVNEVGAMVWNQLATTDVEAAMAFYGELFGWTTEPFEDATQAYWNIRNSAGWLNGGVMPLPAEDVPPHWQVSFSVRDIQDIVRLAQELGGAVLLPPTSTAVGDIAVLRDPAGALFGCFDGETQP
jgi:predicted enzyme related to lactoylglutathione lyase